MAGENQYQTLFLVALPDPLLLHLLPTFHAAAVAGIIGFRGEVAPHAEVGGLAIKIGLAHGDSVLGRCAVIRCRA